MYQTITVAALTLPPPHPLIDQQDRCDPTILIRAVLRYIALSQIWIMLLCVSLGLSFCRRHQCISWSVWPGGGEGQ